MDFCIWLADVFTEIIATFIGGGLLYLVVENAIITRLNENEKRLKLAKEKYNFFTEKYKFLEMIESELFEIDSEVDRHLSLRNNPEPYINFNTSYWNTVQASGKIATLFEPYLVQVLSHYYYIANEVNEINRLILGFSNSTQLNLKYLDTTKWKRIENLKGIIVNFLVFPSITQIKNESEKEKDIQKELIKELEKMIPHNDTKKKSLLTKIKLWFMREGEHSN